MYIPFVDRESEMSKLLGYTDRGFYPVLFIYGPEGCGKTRLLREFIARIKAREDVVAVYIDAQSTERVEDAVYGPKELVEYLSTAIEGVSGVVGKLVAQLLPRAIKKVFEYRLRGKKLVIAVDDVAKPLGLDVVESYAKKLLDLVEWALGVGVDKVFVLATTSEGISMRYLARHSYVSLDMLWNLSMDAAIELLRILNAPRDRIDEIYRYTGGNPRAMIEMYTLRWDVNAWLERLFKKLQNLVIDALYRYREQVADVLDDIDKLVRYPSLRDVLLELNLVIPIVRPCLGYTPSIDRELGIGRFYAWQIPAYREVLKRVVESSTGS